MLAGETILTFLAAAALLAIAPGPDNIFVMTQSALQGPLAGWMVTLGLCTGLIVHSLAVALGVAVIFQTSALVFSALKIIGAGYLIYLAVMAFRASAEKITSEGNGMSSLGRLYLRGIIMNITNPKVSIFFLAFLPQFTHPENGAISVQILILGAMFIAVTQLVFGSIALAAGALGRWLNRSAHAQKTIHRLAGVVFVGLAVRLITASR